MILKEEEKKYSAMSIDELIAHIGRMMEATSKHHDMLRLLRQGGSALPYVVDAEMGDCEDLMQFILGLSSQLNHIPGLMVTLEKKAVIGKTDLNATNTDPIKTLQAGSVSVSEAMPGSIPILTLPKSPMEVMNERVMKMEYLVKRLRDACWILAIASIAALFLAVIH